MFACLMKILSSCWEPVKLYILRDNHDTTAKDEESPNLNAEEGQEDPLLQTRDLEKHSVGEFSLAVIQANGEIQDHSQVETAPGFFFVGVYDGHGGPEASRYIHHHLLFHLLRFALKRQAISVQVLNEAIFATEQGFISLVRRLFKTRPLIAASGSCCLVGVIWNRMLYIANIGDSRAILGSFGRSNEVDQLVVEPLTMDHNGGAWEVRKEVRLMHPRNPYVLQKTHGVSRAIGDAYLKAREFSLDDVTPQFRLPQPLLLPAISAIPALSSRVLKPVDRFLIFASDGLWEWLTNEEAADIVHNNPREGIARKLVEAALREALRHRRPTIKLADLKKIKEGDRRSYHDDITVVVVFLDHEKIREEDVSVSQLSRLIGAAKSSGSKVHVDID